MIDEPICDPAGLCGEIQPDLDRDRARELLDAAAGLTDDAVRAEVEGDEATARAIWREVLGDVFPAPSGGSGGSGAGTGAAAIVAPALIARPRRPVIDAPQG